MLLKNGDNLDNNLLDFIRKSKDLRIFVPYIKIDSLKHLLLNIDTCTSIFVRWQINDLIQSSSDLEVYDYCKSKNIRLFINPRLHMKAFIDSNEKAIIGSCNISSRGINFPVVNNYNYELATYINNLTFEDRLYISNVEFDSILVNDLLFEQIKQQVIDFKINQIEDLNLKLPIDNFLLSSLPMTSSFEIFIKNYYSINKLNKIELNCLVHDLALYKIKPDLLINELKNMMIKAFFENAFIISFLNNLDSKGELYFGSAKEWVHKNCTNVPLPKRWEITENIQILFKWIVELGEGDYIVDTPNYSQRLYSLKFKN